MLLDTPIDYKLPQDRYAERILRMIQEHERRSERTFTTNIYIELSGKKKGEVKSTNTLKHERTDKSIEYLKSRGFIEKIQDDMDKRRVELRTRPEHNYVTMIKSDQMVFWELIEKGYFYFLFHYEPFKNETICPKCGNEGTLTISKSIQGHKCLLRIVYDSILRREGKFRHTTAANPSIPAGDCLAKQRLEKLHEDNWRKEEIGIEEPDRNAQRDRAERQIPGHSGRGKRRTCE